MRSTEPIRDVAIISFVFIFFSTTPPASAATPFVHETVDFVGSGSVSLVLDGRGNPRISYYANGDLKYAVKNGEVWTLETVDAAGDVGEFGSLVLDASGNPRIAYRDQTNGDLKYASKSGGVWTFEIVDTTGFTGAFASLALDPQGSPRIAYTDWPNEDLKYATKFFGTWLIETVDAPARAQFSSLALDASGNPHIGYADALNGDVKYARKLGGTWTLEIADAVGLVGFYASLQLDAQGNPHISYYEIINGDLKYARKSGPTWTAETVDASGNVGSWNTSLELDAQGNPHISYHDDTNGDLKYARKSGSTWTIEVVEAPGNMGRYSSLVLDAQGNPRIAYHDASLGDLKYTDSAVHLVAPVGGESWPVGGLRSIEWSGVGPVDVLLSVDGGRTFDVIRQGLVANSWSFRVPHAPTRFASLRVHRTTPLSTAETDSFFTIDGSIALLNLKAEPIDGGVLLSWDTDPGPQDLAGYKIERDRTGVWQLMNALVQGTSYTDPDGRAGDRYRLSGVNGFGEALWLGETEVTPRVLLSAWPLPYRQGDLSISFAAGAGPGGTPASTEVSVFDLSGRLVRTILRQDLPSGYYITTWDGHDERGERVPSGLYFLHSRTVGSESTHKVTVLR